MTAVTGRTGLPEFGLARLTPSAPAIAGSIGTWTLTYQVGAHGIDDGGAFRVALHTTSDWSSPQFEAPTAPDYATVTVDTRHGARLEARFDPDLGVRPWKKIVQLRVRDAALWPGDTITITFGDRQGGSPGTRVQTFAGPMTFRCLVDAFGTGVYELVPDSPILPMIGGPATTLHVLGSSDVTVGEPFGLVVRANDAWGNVAVGYRGTVRLTLPTDNTLEYQVGASDRGVHRFEGLVVDEPGVHAISASDAEQALESQPHPLRCHAETPRRRVHWGDPHGQTEETVGIGTLDDYFTYARDAAALDFVGHQGNDFQITATIWQAIREKIAAYHEPGRFVTFLGYEWSGNTPSGGDHNVHFLHDDGPLHRSSHWQVPDRADEATDRHPVSRLYEQFRGREDVLLIPHVGGRHANLIEFFDDELIPLVEICSAWGVFEWLTEDALRRGARIGFAGGSDDHTARPGFASPPPHHFGIRGGLTAALASACTREALWEALKARRTYATTGPPHPPRCLRQRTRHRLRVQHERPGRTVGPCGRHRPTLAGRGAAVAGGDLQPRATGFSTAQRPLLPARRLDGGADPRTPSPDPVGRPACCRGWPPTVRSGLGLRPSRGRRDRNQLSGRAVALGDRWGLGRRGRRDRRHAGHAPAVRDRTGYLQPVPRQPLRRPLHPRRRRHRPAGTDRA